VRTYFGQGGRGVSSNADVRTFWRIQLQIFQNLWCVRTEKGGVEPVQTFFGKAGRGQFFAILCGLLLWTALYQLLQPSII